jgi:hypothetical protein
MTTNTTKSLGIQAQVRSVSHIIIQILNKITGCSLANNTTPFTGTNVVRCTSAGGKDRC